MSYLVGLLNWHPNKLDPNSINVRFGCHITEVSSNLEQLFVSQISPLYYWFITRANSIVLENVAYSVSFLPQASFKVHPPYFPLLEVHTLDLMRFQVIFFFQEHFMVLCASHCTTLKGPWCLVITLLVMPLLTAAMLHSAMSHSLWPHGR